VPASGKTIVRHHLIDFGSTLGSGTVQAQSPRAGNEFLWESRPTFVTMLTLGFYVRPWIKVDYPDMPSVGRFESDYFSPERWKPEYPNAAFAIARADDLFWAARILAAVPDDGVRAVVETAKYSDPKATEYIARMLTVRRKKVLASWLNGVNPIVNVALGSSGELTFENASEKTGVSSAAERYTIQWSRFDNASNIHTNVGSEETITATKATAPAALLSGGPEYIAVVIRGFHRDYPTWSLPLTAFFRARDGGWALVGLERTIR
jgi:hypothetical protein